MGTELQTNATLPERRSELPEPWIERLFQKFEDFYGAKWAAQYGAFPRERVKRTWAEALAGFAEIPDALGHALEAQKNSPFPPTLPEFLAQCRNAANRQSTSRPIALEQKLTPEQIERNRARLDAISKSWARKAAA